MTCSGNRHRPIHAAIDNQANHTIFYISNNNQYTCIFNIKLNKFAKFKLIIKLFYNIIFGKLEFKFVHLQHFR